MSVKRLNYFDHQFLGEKDFKDEQAYHIEMRRFHNRLLYTWGVVEGLKVEKKNDREVTVEPGVAIDKDGREIWLRAPATHDLSSFPHHHSHSYVTIAYRESFDKADLQAVGGVEHPSRIIESPEINATHEHLTDGSVVTLARVHLDEFRNIHRIEMGASVRRLAQVAPAAGWVRLPFKPARMYPVRVDRRLVRVVSEKEAEEAEFIVDEADTYCDAKGARGSMEIPVPPGASRITGFRIAGTTLGRVTVHLIRTGWNLHEGRGEKTPLFAETVEGASFHKEIHVDSQLDESHAIAISVVAEGESRIWLVAARFE